MEQPISNLSFDYMRTSERRVINLHELGLPDIPMLGYCQYRKPRPDVPEHWHDNCIEIHYGVRNNLEFNFNNTTYLLAPGEVIVNLPGERHTVSAHPRGLVLYWFIMRLSDTPLLSLPRKESDTLRHALLNLPHPHFRGTNKIKRLFQRLHALADAPKTPLRIVQLRVTTLELLLEIISAAQKHTTTRDHSTLARVIEHLEANPDKSHPIDDLARMAGLAPNHFITSFRQLTGLPPRQYLITHRIKEASRLLRTTQLSVTEISHSLGFCTSQHFATLFKRHIGTTPIAYRAGCPGPSRRTDHDDGQSR